MKILFLDLSTKSTGYAIGENHELINHGCLTASSNDVVKRIIKIKNQIIQLIKKYNINQIIMEEVLPDTYSHTHKVLTWLQGVVIASATEYNPSILYDFLGASTWRAALHIKQGRGVKRQNLKLQDIKYVKDKYNITVNDDEADAICLLDAYYIKDDTELNWD